MPNPDGGLIVPSSEALEEARKRQPENGRPVAPSAEAFDAVVGAQKAGLRSALRHAVTQDPEAVVKQRALAAQAKLPVDVVQRNPEEAQRAARLGGIDIAGIERDHPDLAKWLANPANASIAHDDIPVLQRLDRSMRQLRVKPDDDVLGILPSGFRFDGRGRILEPTSDGRQARVYDSVEALTAELKRRADVAATQATARDEAAQALDASSLTPNLAAGVHASVAATKEFLGTQTDEGRQDAAEIAQASSDLAPGLRGDIVRGIGGLIGDVPLLMAGGPLGEGAAALMALGRTRAILQPVIGKTAAKAVGRAAPVAAAVQPLAIREGVNDGEQHGSAFGGVSWLVETVIPGAFGRTGVERALIPGRDAIGKAGAAGWAGAAGRLLRDSGLEATEEAVTELAHALHERVTVDPTALHPDRLLPRLMAAGAVGGIAGGAFNAPAAMAQKLERDALAIRQSEREAAALSAAFDASRESLTGERDPEALASFLSQRAGVEADRVFLQSEAWEQHWQQRGVDPMEAAESMGVDRATYAAARAGNAQIAVPAAQFFAKTTPEDKALLDHAALRADGMTPTEMGTATEALRQSVSQGMAAVQGEAQAEVDPAEASADAIALQVEDMLVQAGTDQTAARNQAQVMRQFMLTMGKRAGIDPAELFKRYGITIQREGREVLGAEQAPEEPDAVELDQSALQAPGESLAFDDLLKQWRKANGDRTPVQGDADWQRLEAEARAIDAQRGTFYQPGRKDTPRGKLTVGNGRTLSITLMAKADLSTFLHESAHAYLEILTDLAADPNTPQDVKDDVDAIRKWVGNDGGAWTTDQHETFARGFEAWLMEGRAPSSALRLAFVRFKEWLTDIYKTIARLNVELTPEVRRVFDRMLASEREIEAASQRMTAVPLFATAEEMGATASQYAAYVEAVRMAKQRGEDAVRAQVMAVEMAAIREARAAERKEVRAEKEAEVNARPEFVALMVLQTGKVPAEWVGTKAFADAEFKLDRADLVRLYGEEALRRLPGPRRKGEDAKPNAGRRLYTTEGGLGLQDAARLFGYPTGDALWEALVNAPDRKQTIEAETDAEMLRRHPDPLTDGSIREEADAALANELAGDVLVAEVRALAKRSGSQVAASAVLRETARAIIDRTKARDIRPEVYQLAAAKAAREAFEAAAASRGSAPESRGESDALVFQAKQRELFNLHLYRAARDAKEASEKGRDYLRSLDSLEKRSRIGKAGGWEWTVYDASGEPVAVYGSSDEAKAAALLTPGATYDRTSGYLEQIDNILEGYQLKRASLRSLRKREALGAWVARQKALGEDIDLPQGVMDDLGKVAWSDLSVAAQRDLVDAVKAVEHNAALKNKLLKSARERSLEKAREAIIGSIEANAHGEAKRSQPADGLPEKALDGVRQFFEAHRKDSFLAREMDGFKDAGEVWTYLIRPRNEAANEETEALIAAARQRDADLKAWDKSAGVFLQDIPGTRMRLTREQRIGMACNWGNAEGRQRVLAYVKALGFTERDVLAVIDSLDAADWTLVKATWKQLDSYWSDIKALEQRTKGVAPEKVEALPIPTRFGEMPGGYYPLKYDARKSEQADNLDAITEGAAMIRIGAGAPQTKRGHTKQRAQNVEGRALRLDFDVVSEHVNQVVHDITHREMLMDQARLLRDKDISRAINKRYGKGALDQFLRTAVDIATGDRVSQGKVAEYAGWVRRNTSAAVFGFNLTSAIIQVTGLSQSLARVGPAHIASAATTLFGRDPATNERRWNAVQSRSAFMRTRAQTYLREMAEAHRQVTASGKIDTLKRWGFVPMLFMQRAVDTVTWLAAYDKALAERQTITADEAEAQAVAIADQTVIDTQGSGRIGDLAAIQRGGEIAKLFTTFYSYFSVTYNLMRESGARTWANRSDPAAWFKAATDFLMLWTVPAYLATAISGFLRGDDQDEDERWSKFAKDQAAYGAGLLMGVRELSGAIQGFYGYSGPAGLRGFDILNKATQQAMQGEADMGLLKAGVGVTGLFGFPALELQRTLDAFVIADQQGLGWDAIRAGLFGKPRN